MALYLQDIFVNVASWWKIWLIVVENQPPQKVSVLTKVLIVFLFAGGDMLVSGDDQGKIWVYDITKAPKAKSTSSKPPTQKATYVSEEYSSVTVIL